MKSSLHPRGSQSPSVLKMHRRVLAFMVMSPSAAMVELRVMRSHVRTCEPRASCRASWIARNGSAKNLRGRATLYPSGFAGGAVSSNEQLPTHLQAVARSGHKEITLPNGTRTKPKTKTESTKMKMTTSNQLLAALALLASRSMRPQARSPRNPPRPSPSPSRRPRRNRLNLRNPLRRRSPPRRSRSPPRSRRRWRKARRRTSSARARRSRASPTATASQSRSSRCGTA